jgi:hypothetical protein
MVNYHNNSESTTIPDINGCRAVNIDKGNFAECLREGPNSCSYALPFGYCFLCQHPLLNEIVENTKNKSIELRVRK